MREPRSAPSLTVRRSPAVHAGRGSGSATGASVHAGSTPVLLHLGPLPLSLQPPAMGSAGASGGTPNDRRSDRLPDQLCQTLPRRDPVAVLRPVLRGTDGQHRASQPRVEPLKGEPALGRRERRRRAEIEAELDARIGGVDALAARSRGMGELLGQLSSRHDEPVRRSRARRYAQILHTHQSAAPERAEGLGSGPGSASQLSPALPGSAPPRRSRPPMPCCGRRTLRPVGRTPPRPSRGSESPR